MKKGLILIKLGGSLITDKNKPFYARKKVIDRLAHEIKSSLSDKFDLIIGHGSGSFGHVVASKYNTQNGIRSKDSIRGLSLVADAAIQINRIVVQSFLKAELPVVSFAPASFMTAFSQKLDKFLIKQIEISLKIGIVPVIYGDIILDTKQGCCIFSGEKTLDILAKFLKDKYKSVKIILCGDTNGVLDAKNNTIPKINAKILKEVFSSIGVSGGTDVTGGMIHKVESSLKLASDHGIETRIINGKTVGKLKDVLFRGNVENTTLITKN
jgi:isopentenyl phosphate kinase